MTANKPANRKPGPRPRARSSARQQRRIWGFILSARDGWTSRAIADLKQIWGDLPVTCNIPDWQLV